MNSFESTDFTESTDSNDSMDSLESMDSVKFMADSMRFVSIFYSLTFKITFKFQKGSMDEQKIISNVSNTWQNVEVRSEKCS